MLDNRDVEKLEGPPLPSFDCGSADQNTFFRERAWGDQQALISTTYEFTAHGMIAGYATVCMSGIELDRHERGSIHYREVSALKLLQLGVDRPFQGSGYGSYALGFVVDLARTAADRVACRYVVLDAQPDLVPWYERQGFVPNKLAQKRRIADALQHGRDPGRIAVSMRFDLRGIAE